MRPDPAEVAASAAALERAGDLAGAAEAYARTFSAAADIGDPEAMAVAIRRQGWLRCQQQRFDEAAELLELSREIAERAEIGHAAAGAINALATLALTMGRLEDAEAQYRDALERVLGDGNDEMIGSVYQNLGVIANIRGDLIEARALYMESIGAAVRSGNRRGAMMAYNNLGMVHSDLKEWMEAEIYFTRGIEVAVQLDDRAMEAKLHVNRVEPLIHIGEFEEAMRVLRRAADVAGRSNDLRALSDIARFRALIARFGGDFGAAETHLGTALKIAEQADLALEKGEVFEEMARLRWAQARRGAARAVLREARRLYAALGAARDTSRIDRLLEEWAPATAP